jgi:hypothetical protein
MKKRAAARPRTICEPSFSKTGYLPATGEKMNEDGGYEVVRVFTGMDAREQAIRFAGSEFGMFDEIRD